MTGNPSFHFSHEELPPLKLFELDEYKDLRTIKIKSSRVLRCRPIFGKWYCDIELSYEEIRLDEREIIDIVNYAGRYIGLCDYRPKYGRFTASKID